MMKNLDPLAVDIVDELLADTDFDLASNLMEDAILADLISCSGSIGWGLDTYDTLKAWFIEPGKIGFSADVYLDSTPDEETSILGTRILAKVQGEAVKEDEHWEISEHELLEADFYPPNEDYLDEEQLDAILSNTEFYRTFLRGISSLQVLNNLSVADGNARKTLKMQIYIGAITCLETYLSDAFINTVLSNQEYLKSFFSTFKEFKEKKIGINEIFSYVDKAEAIAKKAMLEVSYHNLPKVNKMYKAILDISFPDFSKIQKAVVTRHDLVHRNGKTKEEKEIVVDQKIVKEVLCSVESFVNEIDRKLKEKEQPPESDDLWDRQIGADFTAGKLDSLIAKAEADIAANRVKDLDEILYRKTKVKAPVF